MVYKASTTESAYYSNKKTEYVKFAVLEKNSAGANILFIFPKFKKEEYENRKEDLKPDNIRIVQKTDDEEIAAYMMNGRSGGAYNTMLIKKSDEDPKTFGLIVPDYYRAPEPSYEEIVDDYIDENLFKKISKAITDDMPMAIYDNNYETAKKEEEVRFKYFCPKCKKAFYPVKTSCPTCNKLAWPSSSIVDSKFKTYRKNALHKISNYNVNINDYSVSQARNVFHMTAQENGITLYKISRSVSMKAGKYTVKFAVDYSIVHRIGEEIATYKHLKNGIKKVDPFEALNINTQNINCPPKIIYEDADNFLMFAKKNEKALRMLGFIELLKYYNDNVPMEGFFLVFLGIMNKYPVMEQIVKSGHANLFFTLYRSMKESLNKDGIMEKVASLEQIVNTETTKGKDALRFPSYIGDYLIKKNADLQEYYYWRDIAEVTDISKEQFDKMINSFDYAYINAAVGFKDICNILKYGYKPNKLLAYIIKTAEKTERDISFIINQLADYLSMCELAQVEPDMFPMDLLKQHNEISNYITKTYGTARDRVLYKIGEECEVYVPQDLVDENGNAKIGVPKLFEKYTLVFPKSEKDFVEEGNMQHNCVASYAKRVADGRCVIFFLRKKETPNRSYITGECTTNGLGQFYLSNNRHVDDNSLLDLGKFISNKIVTGISSGKIHAITKVPKV